MKIRLKIITIILVLLTNKLLYSANNFSCTNLAPPKMFQIGKKDVLDSGFGVRIGDDLFVLPKILYDAILITLKITGSGKMTDMDSFRDELQQFLSVDGKTRLHDNTGGAHIVGMRHFNRSPQMILNALKELSSRFEEKYQGNRDKLLTDLISKNNDSYSIAELERIVSHENVIVIPIRHYQNLAPEIALEFLRNDLRHERLHKLCSRDGRFSEKHLQNSHDILQENVQNDDHLKLFFGFSEDASDASRQVIDVSAYPLYQEFWIHFWYSNMGSGILVQISGEEEMAMAVVYDKIIKVFFERIPQLREFFYMWEPLIIEVEEQVERDLSILIDEYPDIAADFGLKDYILPKASRTTVLKEFRSEISSCI